MFDWNDEELTNIIWGEEGETDDHIVPYPDQIEEKPPVLFRDVTKKQSNEENNNVTPVEQKKTTMKAERSAALDSSTKSETGDPAAGFGLDPWPDPSSSNASKADQNSMDDTAQLDNDNQDFQNPPEDKEQGDFVDYGWANIGSFDDLDRIFSNNDPIFGGITVGNTDELWSSSKDVTSSTMRPMHLSGESSDLADVGNSSEAFDIKAESMLDTGKSFLPDYEKLNDVSSRTSQDVQASIDTVENSGGKSKRFLKEKTHLTMDAKCETSHSQFDSGTTAATSTKFPEKGDGPRQMLRVQKSDEESEGGQLQDLHGTWSSSQSPFQQSNSPYGATMATPCPPLVLSEQRQHQHLSGPILAAPVYGNMVNQYPTMSVMPQFHPYYGFEASPGNVNALKKPMNTAVKPPAMTPQEKIEKLRRRQQMRAMLAIQKQQQHFSNQVPVVANPTTQGGDIEDENFSSFHSFDPNSPVEHDDSNTLRVTFGDGSVEDSILCQLQETISQLDPHIRLCIRDSLFRLAQSATQRQYTGQNNTSSGNKIVSKKDMNTHERFSRIPDIEAETNPIDRAVAHFLFHRPLEYSGKSTEVSELPMSAKISYERKDTAQRMSSTGYFSECSESMIAASPRGSNKPGIYSEREQSRNTPHFDTSDNASNKENKGGEVTKVEAST